MEELKKTFVAVINGEAIMAFRAEDEDEAYDLVNESESENGGIKTVLLEYDRADGGMIWDGASNIEVRPATVAERKLWEESSGDAHEEDMTDGEDDWNMFLIDISDPLDDEDDGDQEETKRKVVTLHGAKGKRR
jgi:hypothetical protein